MVKRDRSNLTIEVVYKHIQYNTIQNPNTDMIESTGYNSSEENVINTLISSLILLQHWHTYIYMHCTHLEGGRERDVSMLGLAN